MAYYSIKDLEKLSGIKAHTLRIWEKRYNLVEPKRTETNIRYYDDNDLKKILNVALLNRNGFKISHIAQYNEKEISTKINDISSRDQETETNIDNLVIAMIDLDDRRFEKILSKSIMQNGFEKSILNVIYPFFVKIGMLWQTGAINPAQEHFISNLTRQKLIVAIDGMVEPEGEQSKRFILYLPEGELHELGLLFYHYLIKKRGHKVLYLGQSVPFEDLERVVDIKPCDYILTSFNSSITGININEYISKLSKKFRKQNILFSAFDKEGLNRRLPDNTLRIKDIHEFVEFLENL